MLAYIVDAISFSVCAWKKKRPKLVVIHHLSTWELVALVCAKRNLRRRQKNKEKKNERTFLVRNARNYTRTN